MAQGWSNFDRGYFPEDPKNMSYDETAWHIYGVDIDEKKKK